MSAQDANAKKTPSGSAAAAVASPVASPAPAKTSLVLVVTAWIVVATPLAWGVFQTLKKAAALFS
jgi:hypothetical protein